MDYFFVRRPIIAMVIAIVIIIVGLVSLRTLPTEQYPDITPPQVAVNARYTGANALSVEQSVATPLEQEINGVENMIYMKSTNSNDGRMTINVSFDVGTDPDMNTVFTQNRVATATAKLPEEVKRMGVTTQKSMSNILMVVALTSEDGRYDQNFLGNYSLINIKDVLARISGIGRVDVIGASDYSMRIWIRPDRLAQLGITVPEIVDAVRAQSVIVPGGKFGAEPAPPGTEFTYTVRLPERLQTEEEFGDIVVRTGESGAQVKIRDIARVELGVESYLAFTRMNQRECAMIALYQAPGSNAVQLAQQVREVMNELAGSFPAGMRYDISFDGTEAITAGIHEIVVTLFIALALVILVVFVFIQDWRATLIPTIAIPVSLIGAFIVFPFLGFTINVLSLLGMVLAIGIVVDDAIVVTEAVQVNIEKGMKSKEATNKAIREVMAPVIATTLVLVAVFIPTVGIAGITGRLYQQFAITVTISVIFSSVNALTLSPALCSLILRKSEPYRGPLGKFFGWFERIYKRSSGSYMGLTNVLTRRMKRGMAFIGIAVIAMVVFGSLVPTGFMPSEDMGYLFINLQLPDAASLQRSDVVMRKVEKILSGYDEIEYYTIATGFSLLSGSMTPNSGFVAVSLCDWSDRDRTADELIRRLNAQFRAGIREGQVFAFGPPPIPGLGNGSGFTMMVQDRGGNTPEYLAMQTSGLIRELTQRKEIGSVFTTFRAEVPQRYLDINRDKVLQSGISLNSIYTTIGAFLGGAYVNDFNRFGRLYRTYIQAEPEFRQDQEKMNLFFVKNSEGKSAPLSAFVNVSEISGPDYINRFNLFRAIEVKGAAAPGYTSAQVMSAIEDVAARVLPSDMGFEWSDMSYQEKKASGTGAVVFVFSLIFVFLILAAQYESWSLPLSILLGTPFAVLGAFLALFAARLFSESYLSNVFAQISLVMLIGMAAKNAILIVEFAKLEFDGGLSLFDAAIKSAELRFRPILMTAFSFILGILPLIFASGSGAEARKVMGMSLFGGMMLATILGVFFYPMLFVLVGRVAGYEKNRAELKGEVKER